jgi:hypothetical protein
VSGRKARNVLSLPPSFLHKSEVEERKKLLIEKVFCAIYSCISSSSKSHTWHRHERDFVLPSQGAMRNNKSLSEEEAA